MQRWALDRLTARPAVLLLSFFALILAIDFTALREPPVWDSAASIFPAAIYLY